MNFITLFVVCCGATVVQGWWFFSNDPKEEDEKICLATPQKDVKLGVHFLLSTRAHPEPVDVTNIDLTTSTFDPSKETKFIIHGYTDNGSSDWMLRMVDQFHEHHDVNVICVNWQKGADSLYYGQSAANTRRVGEIIAEFIEAARVSTGAAYSSHHLIGHSLGAHISGFAGAYLGGQVGRITGMDPAGPCFRFAGPDDRLSDTDALFVDAIHSDGDTVLQAGFGTELRMADADFYPNGGEKQPGCSRWFWEHLVDFMTGWFSGFKSGLACSHSRAHQLFTQSINPANQFKSYPCGHHDDYKNCLSCGANGCTRMGYFAAPNLHGIFTLRTHEYAPYSYEKPCLPPARK